MSKVRLKFSFVFVLIAASFAAAQAKRTLTPEDVYRLKTVSDPHLSPDGRVVAYVVTTIDAAKNKRVSSVWTVPADGSGEPKPFVANMPARSPRWSPDGKWLAFISNSAAPEAATPEKPAATPNTPPSPPSTPAASDAKAQVWLVALDGSGRRPVTHLGNGVTRFSWSPDGTQLAVVGRVGGKPRDVRHYSTMIYKSDSSGWSDNTSSHIWIVAVKDGAARQLTSAAGHDDNDPEWSPDGKWIAYVSQETGPDLRDTVATEDLLVIPAAGGTPRAICERHQYVSSPSWSPDSKQLAYAASPTPSDQPALWIADVADPSKASLASDADLFPNEVEWDSTGLWFGAYERGTAPLYRVDVRSHHVTKVLGGDRAMHNLGISDSAKRLVYLANDDTHTPDVFSANLDGSHERQLTFQNRELLDQLKLAESERVSWKSVDGLTIEGFLKRPVDFQPGRQYPMILAIHGGPNGMFGVHWEIDEQLYAANGYAVLTTNPRGSSGYGGKFQRAVANEWGGKAYQDIISGVQAVLARNSWIDRNRLGVVGHSYGGFMTNWIVTQTDMFKAAISISGIADFISVEGTRDGAYGHSRDFGGDLYTNFDEYWKYSPVRLAAKVKTPILFLHGEADNRVPVSQAEEYFRAIKHFGGTAELAIFPHENHGLPLSSEPKHLVETYRWRLYWFDRYVKGDQQAMAPDAETNAGAAEARSAQ